MVQAIGVASGACENNGTQQALTHALLETIRWAVSEEEEKNSPSGDGEQDDGSESEDSDMQAPGSPVSKKKPAPSPKAGIPGGPCAHCGATESPQWRRPLAKKVVLCNACGIYYSRHHSLPKRKKVTEPRPQPASAPEPMDFTPSHFMPPLPLDIHHSDVDMAYGPAATSPAHLQATHVTSRPRFLSGPQGTHSSGLRPSTSSGPSTSRGTTPLAPPLRAAAFASNLPLSLGYVIPGAPSLESTHMGSSHSHSRSRSPSPVASSNDNNPATPATGLKPDSSMILALTGMQPLVQPQTVVATPTSSRKRGMQGVGLHTVDSVEVPQGVEGSPLPSIPSLTMSGLSVPSQSPRVVSWGSWPQGGAGPLPMAPSLPMPNAVLPVRAAASWQQPTVAQQLLMAQAVAASKRLHMDKSPSQSVGAVPMQTANTPTGTSPPSNNNSDLKTQRPTITTAIMDPSLTSQPPQDVGHLGHQPPTTTTSTAAAPSTSPSTLNSPPPLQPSSSFEAATHVGVRTQAPTMGSSGTACVSAPAACFTALPAMPLTPSVSQHCVAAAGSSSAAALVPPLPAGPPPTMAIAFSGAPLLPPLRTSPPAMGLPHTSEQSAESESVGAGMLIGVYACRGPRAGSVGAGGGAPRRPTSGTPPASPTPCASNC